MGRYRITYHTADGFTHLTILWNGAIVASGVGRSVREAIRCARTNLYNRALHSREGSDRAYLARYNARMGTSARSLHD